MYYVNCAVVLRMSIIGWLKIFDPDGSFAALPAEHRVLHDWFAGRHLPMFAASGSRRRRDR